MRLTIALLLALLATPTVAAAGPKALFDNAHAETAGNADWVIDDNQPIPSPAQGGITPGTLGTYWTGAISSWGVALVKRGYTVHTNTTALTYGNTGNTYDLANYDVLILPEPNTLFSAAEATAIFSFVQNGGGLVVVVDHWNSDRNSDGWDSPEIWNALDPTRVLGGVHAGESGDPNNNIVQTSTNVNPSASDSITHGPAGTVTGLAFHNGTTFTMYPASNPTVRGEVWMNGLAQSSTSGLMAVSSQYGSGRVFLVGDSSPADDGSAQPGNSNIFDGWGEAGATDSTLFLNATLWASRRAAAPDNTPPSVTVTSPNGGETWKAGSTHAITWSATDAVGVTAVAIHYSTDGGATFPNSIAGGLANSGSYDWAVPDVPGTALRVRVTATDAAANSGADASNASFTVDRWIITASAGAGGGITPSGSVGVVQGASQGFTIAPLAGYSITGVTVDGGPQGAIGSYTFTGVTGPHSIVATFADTGAPLATLLSPNGGEAYSVGDTVQVSWTASDPNGVASVDLRLSRSGAGGPFETVAAGLANDGTESWLVTGPPTSDAWLQVVARDPSNNAGTDLGDAAFSIETVAGVGEAPVRAFGIESIAPNPARGAAEVSFAAPRATTARVSVIDAQGREVARLFEGGLAAGRHTVRWNASRDLAAGLYWVRFASPEHIEVRRVVMLR